MKVCSVEGCSRKCHARGYCDMHYKKLRGAGTLLKLSDKEFKSDSLRPVRLSEGQYQNILAWFRNL